MYNGDLIPGLPLDIGSRCYLLLHLFSRYTSPSIKDPSSIHLLFKILNMAAEPGYVSTENDFAHVALDVATGNKAKEVETPEPIL